MRRIAKQVQGALPIVGLLSRLGSPGGGIGTDLLVIYHSQSFAALLACPLQEQMLSANMSDVPALH